MIIDLHRFDASKPLNTDFCVVGGGPAGITLARMLAQSTHRDVVLLEGGGLDPEGDTQALYEGAVESDLDFPIVDYLAKSRIRALGGSSFHWWAFCRRFDRLDFEVRNWVPDSGWPITLEDLRSFYPEAATICGIRDFDYDPSATLVADPLGEKLLELPGNQPVLFHTGIPPVRFRQAYQAELGNARNIRLFLHANVTELLLDPSFQRLERVRAKTLGGKQIEVRARNFVLATGGIENARLLLNSDGQIAGGIGNQHDRVGRYFMEHPHLDLGILVLPSRGISGGIFDYGHHSDRLKQHVLATLAPTRALQERAEILNASVQLVDLSGFPEGLESPLDDSVVRLAENLWFRRPGIEARTEPGQRLFLLKSRCEQAPNPESRVALVSDRDALGQRRVKLQWRLTDLDRRSWLRWMELLGREVGAGLGGRVRTLIPSDRWPSGIGGNHHMGTTRMHRDPSQGVVDSNCRVHGVENLWIAGSSVFATSGAANPTLTLVALALRLAAHLETRPVDTR